MFKNQISAWNFQENKIRTIDIDGEIWWILRDVCVALEMDANRAGEVIKRLDEDEYDSIGLIDSLGRTQNVYIINECGLYDAILRSDKPKAKQFRRWVTHEVLPTIRKTGGYNKGKDAFDVAALLVECPTARLGVVLEILKHGGYDVPGMEALQTKKRKRGREKNERNPEVINTMKDLCDNYGVKKGDIAKGIGVTHSAISQYLSGRRYPDKHLEKKLIIFLNRLKEKTEEKQENLSMPF